MTLLIALTLFILGILGLVDAVTMATWLAVVLIVCGALLIVAPRIGWRA